MVLPSETVHQPGTKTTETPDRSILPNLLIYFYFSIVLFKMLKVAKKKKKKEPGEKYVLQMKNCLKVMQSPKLLKTTKSMKSL